MLYPHTQFWLAIYRSAYVNRFPSELALFIWFLYILPMIRPNFSCPLINLSFSWAFPLSGAPCSVGEMQSLSTGYRLVTHVLHMHIFLVMMTKQSVRPVMLH